MSIRTKSYNIDDILVGLNIDLKSSVGVFASLKGVQCWKSMPKYMLTCVNSNLCPVGICSILERSLLREQRKLCQKGKLPAIEYIDRPLPSMKVYLKAMREIRGLPEDKREDYSLDPYPLSTRQVYHIKAGLDAWEHLDKLLKEYVASGRINNDFGPAAYLLQIPQQDEKRRSKLGLDPLRNYHEGARIACGYNIRTTVLDCKHVQSWFHPVKVAMTEVDELDENGNPTGNKVTPRCPYERTWIAKEMMNLTINGHQVFHTFVPNQTGFELGVTRCVIMSDPNNPYTPAIKQFAKNCVANLHCFLYHHLSKTMGFHESTVNRLVNCCWLNSAAVADQSDWDPVLQKATPIFRDRSEVMRQRNRQYDFKKRTDRKGDDGASNSPVEMSDAVRLELTRKLRCNPDKTMQDAMEADGRASVLTGMPGRSVCTDATEANTLNDERNKQDLAIKLALEKRDKANAEKQRKDMEKERDALRAEVERLRLMAQQQGTPHLSGSGTPPPSQPDDRGGGGRRA